MSLGAEALGARGSLKPANCLQAQSHLARTWPESEPVRAAGAGPAALALGVGGERHRSFGRGHRLPPFQRRIWMALRGPYSVSGATWDARVYARRSGHRNRSGRRRRQVLQVSSASAFVPLGQRAGFNAPTNLRDRRGGNRGLLASTSALLAPDLGAHQSRYPKMLA
jgi:hypothetical protein